MFEYSHRTLPATQAARTFWTLQQVLERARIYLTQAYTEAVSAVADHKSASHRMLLMAIAGAHNKLLVDVEATASDEQLPNRFFQSLPESLLLLTLPPPSPPPTLPEHVYTSESRAHLEAWRVLWTRLATQSPPDCRTREVLLALSLGFASAQRRIWTIEREAQSY